MAIAKKAAARTATNLHSRRRLKANGDKTNLENGRLDHRGHLMKMISLRLPVELDARMDLGIQKRLGRISRNTYILQAIEEKLGRDKV
jgi:hypothetical protein